MSNYNTTLQSNNTDLQTILQTLQTKATGGEQATPIISVNSANGLITATAGTKTSTNQLAFQPAKTIIPSMTSQVAVSSGYYTGGNIIVAGDSNLVSGNIKSGVSIFGVSGTLKEGSDSGGSVDDVSKSIIEGTIREISDDSVKKIKSYTFNACYNLTSVSFPACTTIGMNAFAFCSKLASVNFPACISIGGSAFWNCDSLTSVSFPVCTTMFGYAFTNCSNLTSVNFPACTTITSSAFAFCSNLTSVNFPACTTITSSAFAFCSNLTSVNFPACISINGSTFAFCRTLSSLTLGASIVCTLTNSNAFHSTPYTGYSVSFSGTPYIYVPGFLISAYKTATNWTYFSSYFSAIPGTEVDSGDSGDLITFTIAGISGYHAEEGMTWGEWVESKYNTSGFINDYEYIFDANYMSVTLDSEGDIPIKSNNAIIDGHTYYTM